MSIWFALSEWFGDVPTLKIGLWRGIVIAVVAIAMVISCLIIQAPAGYAAVIIVLAYVANGIVVYSYLRQRQSR